MDGTGAVILALDTSGSRAIAAAVAGDGTVLAAGTGGQPRAHAEELAPLAATALAAGTPELIVVGRGPGSFTGLRVALVFGQMLAWARQVPVTGICSLDAVAEQHDLTDGWVVTDARRAEVYLARYDAGRRVADPQVLPRGQALASVGTDPVVGDVDLLTSTDRRAAGRTVIDPHALAAVAVRAAHAGRDETLAPLYLRRPDVTMSRANTGARP